MEGEEEGGEKEECPPVRKIALVMLTRKSQ